MVQSYTFTCFLATFLHKKTGTPRINVVNLIFFPPFDKSLCSCLFAKVLSEILYSCTLFNLRLLADELSE